MVHAGNIVKTVSLFEKFLAGSTLKEYETEHKNNGEYKPSAKLFNDVNKKLRSRLSAKHRAKKKKKKRIVELNTMLSLCLVSSVYCVCYLVIHPFFQYVRLISTISFLFQ